MALPQILDPVICTHCRSSEISVPNYLPQGIMIPGSHSSLLYFIFPQHHHPTGCPSLVLIPWPTFVIAPPHFSSCSRCPANLSLFSVKIKTSFALPLYQDLTVAEETYKPGQPNHCSLNHSLKQVLVWVLHIPSPWLLPLHLFVSLQTSRSEPNMSHQLCFFLQIFGNLPPISAVHSHP